MGYPVFIAILYRHWNKDCPCRGNEKIMRIGVLQSGGPTGPYTNADTRGVA